MDTKAAGAKYQLVSPPSAPAQPSALPLSSSQMAVSWSASSPSVTGHRLERQNSDGSWSVIATIAGNVTSYIDAGLNPGVTYSYRVSAINILGSSPVSSVASVAIKSADSGSGVFPLNGLQFWLRADAGVTTDATGAVSAWADQAGGGYSASQSIASSKPLLIANDVNGRAAVRFDGGDDWLDSNFSGMSGQELTFFVVTKGTQYQSLLRFQPAGSGNYLVYPWSSYQVFIDSADGGTGVGVYCGLVSDQWNIGVATCKAGDQMTTYRNGEWVAGRTAANVALPGGLPLNLGRYMGGSEFLQADVAEVLIFNRALSNVERGQIEDYLNEKYNRSYAL
jgi:hypothetical protein